MRTMNPEDALVKKHDELVRLFIHEDNLAWNLIYFCIVINLGIATGLGSLASLGTTNITLASMTLLSLFGALVSVSWFFTLRRSKIHWEAIVLEAHNIERQMEAKGINLNTFEKYEYGIFFKRLKCQQDGTQIRLKYIECIDPLRFLPYLMLLMGVVWSIIAFAIVFNNVDLKILKDIFGMFVSLDFC